MTSAAKKIPTGVIVDQDDIGAKRACPEAISGAIVGYL